MIFSLACSRLAFLEQLGWRVLIHFSQQWHRANGVCSKVAPNAKDIEGHWHASNGCNKIENDPGIPRTKSRTTAHIQYAQDFSRTSALAGTGRRGSVVFGH